MVDAAAEAWGIRLRHMFKGHRAHELHASFLPKQQSIEMLEWSDRVGPG